MKKFITVIVSFLSFTSAASALMVESRYSQNSAGAYIKEVQVSCASHESADCLAICDSPQVCRRAEPYCLNCAGTASSLLRQLFTEIATLYTVTGKIFPHRDLVHYLGTESYVLLGANSIFNYYKPVGGKNFVDELNKLCPSQGQDPLMAVRLNSERQPVQLSFIICKEGDQSSIAYEVTPRKPEIGIKALSTQIEFKLH